jgi:hypothetical protein
MQVRTGSHRYLLTGGFVMFRSSVSLLAAILLLVQPASLVVQKAQAQSASPEKLQSRQVMASASGSSVRFVALGELIQMRLEVIGSSGEVLFDSNFKTGNVIDWSLTGTQGQQLADGSYVCVVSVKDASGQLSRRKASAILREHLVSLQQPDRSVLTAAQVQAAGAGTDDDVSMTIVEPEPSTATATLGHDGSAAHLVSGQGGLTFSSGDFFANQLREQMRLTPDGNLGIGVTNPQARLDVAGAIRASQGIIFPDGSIQFSAARKTFGTPSKGASESQQHAQGEDPKPAIAGTGTTGKVSKWLDGPNGVLGDSVITELNGSIGINGAPNSTFKLDVNGHNRFRGSNVSFYLTGTKATGNEWLFQTVDADGRLRVFDNTSGAERFSMSQSGNVGIGVTPPAARIHITGASSAAATPIAILNSTGLQVPLSFRIDGLERARIRSDDSGNLTFATLNGGSNNLHFRAGDDTTSDMFIQSSTGRVGIGTVAPVSSLDVTNTEAQIRFGRTATDTGGFLVSTSTSDATLSGGARWNGSDWVAGQNAVASMTRMTNGEIRFFTNGVTAGATFTPTERMRIETNGRIGIGTTSPANPLHVVGPGTDSGGPNGFPAVVAHFTQATATEAAAVSIDAPSGQPSILYLAKQGAPEWDIRNEPVPGKNLFKIRSHNADGTTDTRLTMESNGNVGIGTTNPSTRLDVHGNSDEGHVAVIHNTSGSVDADVLRLIVSYDMDYPSQTNNFITFVSTVFGNVGAIQGNGSGGIELVSGSGDYAEFLPRLNPAEQIQAGEIIGLYGGRISKQTRGASKVMVVSGNPIVVGNDPGEKARDEFERVAFIGQVMVRVRGKVQAGDFIVASGLDDGVAVAISPECITSEQFAQTVGQAWEASLDPGIKSVRTAVGLIQGDPTVSRLLESSRNQNEQLSALKSESAAWEKQITELKTANAALRLQNASMDARLSSLESKMTRKSAAHKSPSNLKRRVWGGRGM